MIWVTAAEYLHDYVVRIRFNDKTERTVDLKDTIFKDHRPIFAALRDPGEFSRFQVEMDTLVWENGLNLAPEYLYALPALSGASTGDGQAVSYGNV